MTLRRGDFEKPPDVVTCPACGERSAFAWQDADAYGQFTDGIIPGGFRPEPGSIAHVGASSCWEWQCGHCHAHVTDRDSPLTANVFTHCDD